MWSGCRQVKIEIVLLAVLLIAVQAAEAKSFRLEPGDPHWIREYDPANVLNDMGEYWESAATKGQPRPEIYFKLPEVATTEGRLTLWYGKDIPDSLGWDSLQLWASKSQSGPYIKLWSCPEWGYVDRQMVIVGIPAGYQYLKFRFVDGDEGWETLRLWKEMDIFTSAPSPTPTPTPTQPTPAPTAPPIVPGFELIEVVLAILGLIGVAYLLRR